MNQTKSKTLNNMKTFIILPLLTYSKLEDGTKQINIGWIKKIFTINIKIK